MTYPAMKVRLRQLRACFVSWLGLCPILALLAAPPDGPATFRVATFNLENYLDQPMDTRPAKSAASRARIRESLHALGAQVVALQEMGGTNELLELRASLRAEGLDYPYWDHVAGADPHIHVALLSQFPITARRPHTSDSFLLLGRKFRVSRGFLEADLRVNARYSFTLITVHLKSRRPVPEADEAELREQEALLLRDLIDARLRARPEANLVVLGDLNDTKDSPSVRALIGRGKFALFDTRPAERNGDTEPAAGRHSESRQITWTHHYAKEDSFSRLDYILVSKGMLREWLRAETCVLASPDWGVASDHRPIVAGFVAEDK